MAHTNYGNGLLGI